MSSRSAATTTVVTLLATVLVAVLAGCASGNSAPAAERVPTAASRGTVPPPPAAPHRTAARVASAVATKVRHVSRCKGKTAGQLVVVTLAEQRLWLCSRGRTVRSYPITSGRTTATTRTPTGTFHIQGRNRNSVLTLGDGRQFDVRYWIPFEAPDFGFHDAPWQHIRFGSSRYRTHGSHGCIHLSLHGVRFLYDWVHMGTRVKITAS